MYHLKIGSSCNSASVNMEIEHSSPLAAMQASPAPALLGRCFEAPTSYHSLSGLGTNGFNFKDLSMKKSGPDYFNMNPLRGSSPTASLAADLSQNFHIDQRFVIDSKCLTFSNRIKES